MKVVAARTRPWRSFWRPTTSETVHQTRVFSSEVDTGSRSNQVYADCVDLSAQKTRQNKNLAGNDPRPGIPRPLVSHRTGTNFPTRASPDRVNDAEFARAVSHKEYVDGIGLQRTAFALGLLPQETPDISKARLMAIA